MIYIPTPIINLLADDKNVIMYRPKMNQITGSMASTIVLNQILYWARKWKFEPFYKFKEPCKHKEYIEGDSWAEELGITAEIFDKAVLKLKKYVTTKMTQDRKTFYTINREILEKDLAELYSNNEIPKTVKHGLAKPTNTVYQNRETPFSIKAETTSETTSEREETPPPKEINKVVKPSIPSLSLNSKSFEITQNEVVEAKKEISKELITTKLGLDSEEMSEYKTIFDLYKFLNIKKPTTIEEFNQILDNPPKGFENGKFSTMCWGGWINEVRSKNLQNKKEKEIVQNQIGNKIKITMIDFINETSGLQGQELSNFEQNYYF